VSSAVARLAELPPRRAPELPPLSLDEVVALRLPLCFVVEPDVMWAEQAIEALLDRRTGVGSGQGGEAVVARWTRGRGWVCLGGFGFALSGAEAPTGTVGDELVRLAGVLASGTRRGHGGHPLDGAVFSIRGLQPELQHLLTAEILVDLVRQLSERGATLLVELHAVPEPCGAWRAAARLGPVLALDPAPMERFAAAIGTVREAAAAMHAAEPDPGDVVAVLAGLTQLQATAAARVTRSACEAPRLGTAVLDILAASCERVRSVLEGIAE
jgi:hypothetical protein